MRASKLLCLLMLVGMVGCGPKCKKGHDLAIFVPESSHLEKFGGFPGVPWMGEGIPVRVVDPAHYETKFVCDEYEQPKDAKR